MIYIDMDNWDYYDDANTMVKSFYPRTDVAMKKDASVVSADDRVLDIRVADYGVTEEISKQSKGVRHNEFKKQLYLKLSAETGKELPWGYLTGVRPSKIAYMMRKEGNSEESIYKTFTEDYLCSDKKARLAMKVAATEKGIVDKLDVDNGYSLYIGIPFCPTTCMYCSFTSYSIAHYKDMVDSYLDALVKEIRVVGELMGDRKPDTVYVGGGTPTTLEPYQLERLLTELDRSFGLDNIREVTVEAGRPDSITRDKLKVLKSFKVRRISINPQTMNDKTLELIGRRHNVSQIKSVFNIAREEGFDNINMDIILGLPGEDVAEVRHTLDEIIKLRPESLTVHSLAIKRAAALNIWRDKYTDLSMLNTDEIMAMTESAANTLGLEPYYMYRQKNMAGNLENVGYSVPGKECIYNIVIMEEVQSIIALGAGASSKRLYSDGTIQRVENVKDVKTYIEKIDEMIERKRRLFAQD